MITLLATAALWMGTFFIPPAQPVSTQQCDQWNCWDTNVLYCEQWVKDSSASSVCWNQGPDKSGRTCVIRVGCYDSRFGPHNSLIGVPTK